MTQSHPSAEGQPAWTRTIDLDRLRASGRATVKLGSKQLALFLHDGTVHACNNRCPHEGYPLVEGALDAESCVLTCHWHNWKFDLRTGANHYGGDSLRIYPVKVDEAGVVWVDARDAPARERMQQALDQLEGAMADHDAPRIARELARLGRAGAAPEVALLHAIERGHERLRYGMTHCFAAAEVWMRLRDSLGGEAERLACAAEALSHIAYDTLREPVFAFALPATTTEPPQRWDGPAFLAAVEAQDEAGAAGLIVAALENEDPNFADLEPTLATAALAHYNDFGHALIYLVHVRGLVARLGAPAQRPLLLAWLRMLVYATREDLLPDFRHYAVALTQWPAIGRGDGEIGGDELGVTPFVGRSVRDTLAAVVTAAVHASPLQLHHALMHAAALHLLRFDISVEQRTDNPVAENVGWLDFSHALTFGHAVRLQCTRQPELWPQALLQMAMFVGRNTPYLAAEDPVMPALRRWAVADAEAFDAQCIATLLDHGLALYIFPVHLLKTWAAVRDEIALGVPDAAAEAMRAAVNRLFSARFKQRHVLRTAIQAMGFVARED
ncbi:MAG: Rieske (2Fe-2S) protein [Burkholderiales bacterium]|nr:Rieske (2Fe-2S) protein [Burkholderiales bacterium]